MWNRGRAGAAALLLLTAASAVGRNSLWRDEVRIWGDSARKSRTSGRPLTNKAAELVRMGRYQDALAPYREALKRDPDDSTAHSGLAFAYYHLGRYSDAVSEYREAIRASDQPLYHKTLAAALEKAGDLRGAILEMRGFVRLSPDDVAGRGSLLTLLQEAGDYRRYLLQLIGAGRTPREPLDLLEAGWACVGLERNAEAEGYLRRALALGLDRPAVHYYLGLALGRLGRAAEAVGHMESAMRDPLIFGDADAHYNLGILYDMKGNARAAASEYLLALERDPEHSHAHNNLGALYESWGRKDEAIAEIRAALKADPGNDEARRNLTVLTGTP